MGQAQPVLEPGLGLVQSRLVPERHAYLHQVTRLGPRVAKFEV